MRQPGAAAPTRLPGRDYQSAQALRETVVPSGVVDLVMLWVTVHLLVRALCHHTVTRRLIEIAMRPQALEASAAKTQRATLTARGQITLKKKLCATGA